MIGVTLDEESANSRTQRSMVSPLQVEIVVSLQEAAESQAHGRIDDGQWCLLNIHSTL